MIHKITAFLTFLLTFLFTGTTSLAFAQTIPSFPACTNPQGAIRVSHTNGTHGIAGNTASYSGSDTVYQISADTLTQCFCSINGDGIQTNWWKVSSLSQSEIDNLRNLGWVFIPNGTLWGLDEAAYMAFNSDYACGGQGGQVLGASSGGDVLGLAATGNIILVYGLLLGGLTSLGLGVLLRKSN